MVGVGSVVKETVDKRKKPVTVTTHTSKTIGGKTNRKWKTKDSGSGQFDVIMRREANMMVVPRTATPVSSGNRKSLDTKPCCPLCSEQANAWPFETILSFLTLPSDQ